MKGYHVIATGGTIASGASSEGLRANVQGQRLVDRLDGEIKKKVASVSDLCCKPSPEMGPADWLELIDTMKKEEQHCDGFLVLHGTDTLCCTAAAMALGALTLKKPIVVTGAMKGCDEANFDGLSNLADGLLFLDGLTKWKARGAYVAFNERLYWGGDVRKVSYKGPKGFESPTVGELGMIRENEAWLCKADFDVLQAAPLEDLDVTPDFDSAVVALSVLPGLTVDMAEALLNHCRGLVLSSYGSGGVAVSGDASLLPLLDEAVKRAVTVVNVTPCTADGIDLQRYQNGRRAAEQGLISGGTLTIEAALVKTMWLLPRCGGDLELFKKAFAHSFWNIGTVQSWF